MTVNRLRLLAVTAALSVATQAAAQPKPGEVVSFVTCPVFRDIALGRGCWMAEHKGVLFFVGARPKETNINGFGYMRPVQDHQMLVEGVISDDPKACGGVVINPIRISMLPKIDRSCNKVLPAEGHETNPSFPIELTDNIWTGGGRPDPAPPTAPFSQQRYEMYFRFNNSFLEGPAQDQIQVAAIYAKTSGAKVEVVGYAAGAKLSNGRIMPEDADRALTRAQAIAEAFRRLGVDPARITTRADPARPNRNGAEAPALRRVVVTVTPG